MRLRNFGLVLLLLALTPLNTARAVPVLTGEYKLPASFDPEVATELETEEWAQVWRPQADGLYPLVIFLHGNHGTCGHYDTVNKVRIDDDVTYTYSGTCPDGYVVTPNHRGYDYLAADLASHGYVVVSINANRGVNGAPGVDGDDGLNLRRGRLVLRHMELLSQWNAHGGAPDSLGFQLTGLLDFKHVGLMGQSRGGEGVRAAVAQYKDKGSPWPARIGKATFEAMFEIGPVDGQTSRILNNTDTQWNVLLPGCDGDVSDLEGLRPYDRGLQITTEKKNFSKSTFEVFGTNHNFFNTEWQVSDAMGCIGQTSLFPQYKGSKAQRATAHDSVIPFFMGRLGASARKSKAKMFDPSYPLPAKLTSVTAYGRGFTPAPKASENFIVDNFDKATGTSSEGVPDDHSGLAQYFHSHGSDSDDPTQRAANVLWNAAGGFLQVNATAAGQTADVSGFPALEFRVGLPCSGSICSSNPDPSGDVDFSIALSDGQGNLSAPVILKDVSAVHRPAGAYDENVIFQTVRVPVADFAGFDPSQFHGVRFLFNRTSSAWLYLANVRFTRSPAGPGGLSDTLSPGMLRANAAVPFSLAKPDSNAISSIRPAQLSSGEGVVEIELTSSRPFPIADALPVLAIGDRRYRLSRILPGKPARIIFTLHETEYAAIPNGAAVTLRVGGAHPWAFGAFRK